MHLFPYKWNLSDGYPSQSMVKNNYNVFGTFICGGGSSMGYKLAGFNHLGGVEIDPKIANVYKLNHNPKYLFVEDIREFNKRTDLPDELYNLDILDGSPPCSTFSMAGAREKGWGVKKMFKEGQSKQVLDDLVFVYCGTILKLKPKVAILENVKGLIQANARAYCLEIKKKLELGGYVVQINLLNAASMGVPQKRERVFFICYRKELDYPKLKLEFEEEPILFGEVSDNTDIRDNLTDMYIRYWNNAKAGDSVGKMFCIHKLSDNEVARTILSSHGSGFHSRYRRKVNDIEHIQIGSYPQDYNFSGIDVQYLIGMSVPPVMIAQIANQIRLQWLDK